MRTRERFMTETDAWRAMRGERAGLAIVGASAAGLAAALSAARAGADVVLLEARARVGDPPAHAIVGFDHLWPEAIARPPESVRRRLRGMHLRGPSGGGPRVEAPLTLFRRDRLDAHLASLAQQAGARILPGVRGLEAKARGRLEGEGFEVEADIVLFADGAASQASRFLATVRAPEELRWGAVLELEAPDADDAWLTLTLGSHAEGGRSQLNPLGEGRWSHWTFFRGEPVRAEAIARRALALDARLQRWREPAARFAGVAPDPVYTVPGELVADGVMVAGGAAGQGGLEMGLTAGWMAGETAAAALAQGRIDRRALAPYQRAWRGRYQKGYRRLRALTDRLARLTDAEIATLTEAWDEHWLDVAELPSARPLLRRPRGALALARAAFLAAARA